MELIMSNKTFEGNVSIVKNTKGQIALKRDHEGAFNAGNADECLSKLVELAKAHKSGINTYSLFMPDVPVKLDASGTPLPISPKDVVIGDKQPVLLANRYGNPYIALLPKRTESNAVKSKVTKLA
jgi:hypothetical protein